MAYNIKPLIKYIGNKHRFASEIIATFPADFGTYYEPFLGSAAVLGRLGPSSAVASDVNQSLIDLWNLVKLRPHDLHESYANHLVEFAKDRESYYKKVKADFNKSPNPLDFLFISRTCYGGVIRFRKDGYLSTPLGPHKPIPATVFHDRLLMWHQAVANTEFMCSDYATILSRAGAGDVVYCDPPYSDNQKIIYGAQAFSMERLYADLVAAKARGAFIALSIDGTKKSGSKTIAIVPPEGLFEVESFISLGGSMLKRFQRDGSNVQDEHVTDRLLLSGEPPAALFSFAA